jgi:putative SOS response-associated peptidase YedK
MCGRFTQLYSWPELVALYRLTMPPVNLQPSYNVCPTDPVDVILPKEGGGLDFARMRWGLVPYWWSKPLKQLPATFNARSDGVETKPMYRDAFKKRRCVIPISGFYEWRQMADGKQPFFISGVDAPVLSVAGLWDNWKNRETGETIRSCTMIVTEANPFMSEIHDRMPVFLGQETLEPWLARKSGTDILLPASAAHLTARPVSRRVNSSKAAKDDRTLIEAVEPGTGQLRSSVCR